MPRPVPSACLIAAVLLLTRAAVAQVAMPAVAPARQIGSTGPDRKAAATGGVLLGNDFGSRAGDFAEYAFDLKMPIAPAHLAVRYARQDAGGGQLIIALDGADVGPVAYQSTGGWGDRAADFATATLALPMVAASHHTLRLTVAAEQLPMDGIHLTPHPTLDLVGNRSDKDTVGHGRNVALYTGSPARFFFATYELGDVFTAADGRTVTWRPDQVVLDGAATAAAPRLNVNLDLITIAPGPTTAPAAPPPPEVIDRRQLCVTTDDVVVARITLTNTTDHPVTHRLTVAGDCRRSFDWRNHPGGTKQTTATGNAVLMVDRNVFPGILPDGLSMAIGSTDRPTATDVATPGRYALTYDVPLPPHGTVVRTVACAINRSSTTAMANLDKTLHAADPVADNTAAWADFFDRQVPQFDCDDRGLTELYAFRWFLLKFSTAGGDLGLFKYPVTMEGRQAFQTYCCYSAPFMAFDLNWAADPAVGFNQVADMALVAEYPDGRLPWYCSPVTNHVPLDHPSGTGCSLLPWAAWRGYVVHGRKDLLAQLYPAMRRDVDWWIADRDPRGVGLFEIDHQLETGMDDLHRRWPGKKPKRYQAVDATCYTILNLRAVAHMAGELGDAPAAAHYAAVADHATAALNALCWDAKLQRYRDRDPDTGALSDYNCITIFYPLFAAVAGREQLPMIDRYLTNPDQYALPWPVPALSKADPEFDPVKRYWAGPTWPATNSHVAEGFIDTAKRLDRARLPRAAQLFRQVCALQLQPRPDFYEHYDPFTGRPLSAFRDYMHSWWIDGFVRHVAGLTPADDGSLTVDPLPLGLKRFALRHAVVRGRSIDVLFNSPAPGLTVNVDGRTVVRRPDFTPGGPPISVP